MLEVQTTLNYPRLQPRRQALGLEIADLMVCVPHRAPLDDEQRQRDPFALYAACGAIFPEGDGDEYLSLCLKARPDHATEVRRIFQENPGPPFAVIDAIGGGAGWPNLQAALRVESAREILFALLAPEERQIVALQGQETWLTEARALLHGALGLNLLTRAKSYGPIADELWRFLLFSEFAFDLPEALPAALAGVPRAQPEAQPFVEDLCDLLRNNRRTQALYITRAEEIEASLGLPDACRHIADLGVRTSRKQIITPGSRIASLCPGRSVYDTLGESAESCVQGGAYSA